MLDIRGCTISFNRGEEVAIILEKDADSLFEVGDTVKFSIMKRGDCSDVILQKIFTVEEESNTFCITLTSDETRIGPAFKTGHRTYWYEIERNESITLMGYNHRGPKELILYPEAGQKKEAK